MKKILSVLLTLFLLFTLLNCKNIKPIEPPTNFNENNNALNLVDSFDLQVFLKQIESGFNTFANCLNQFLQNYKNNLNSEAYYVNYVIDGDTFVINKNGEEIKVRLIGVDTPESAAKQEYLDKTGKENTPEGKIASDYVKSLINNQTVYLEYDVGKEDIYGRTLAYVYLDPEKTLMLQELLLQKGLAKTMTIMPNIKYSLHFTNLEKEAKENNVGFWNNDIWKNVVCLNNQSFYSFGGVNYG